MTRHDELYENYEDALFALLMEKIAEEEGKKYLEESERLNQDPNAEIPESLDRKCRNIINREFAKSNRRKRLQVAKKVLSRVAIVALISIMLFMTAYALVPEVRIRTLNLLIEISDVATTLTFNKDTSDIISVVLDDGFFGYVIPDVPEGFVITDQGSNSQVIWIDYENSAGAVISFSILGSATSVFNVDTEDADSVEKIVIHGYEGLIIEKGEKIHIVWGDIDQAKYVNVICRDIDMDTAIDLANGMRPQM